MLASAQLDVLDGYCGAAQAQLRERVRAAYERVRELERRVDELRELAGARERELDLLAFELDEIEAADPTRGRGAGADRRARPAPAPRGAAGRGGGRRRGDLARERRRGVRELLARAAQELEAGGGDRSGARGACAAARRRCATRPRTSAASCGATAGPDRGRGRRPGAARGGRGAARGCSPGSSASTAAGSRRCSPTPSAAGRGATSWSTPIRRSRMPSASSARHRPSAIAWPVGCRTLVAAARRSSPRPSASGWPSWRWPTRGSRSSSGRARRLRPAGRRRDRDP